MLTLRAHVSFHSNKIGAASDSSSSDTLIIAIVVPVGVTALCCMLFVGLAAGYYNRKQVQQVRKKEAISWSSY